MSWNLLGYCNRPSGQSVSFTGRSSTSLQDRAAGAAFRPRSQGRYQWKLWSAAVCDERRQESAQGEERKALLSPSSAAGCRVPPSPHTPHSSFLVERSGSLAAWDAAPRRPGRGEARPRHAGGLLQLCLLNDSASSLPDPRLLIFPSPRLHRAHRMRRWSARVPPWSPHPSLIAAPTSSSLS